MASAAKPRLDPQTAYEVISPESYAGWDPLLDTFDRLREGKPGRLGRGPRRPPPAVLAGQPL